MSDHGMIVTSAEQKPRLIAELRAIGGIANAAMQLEKELVTSKVELPIKARVCLAVLRNRIIKYKKLEGMPDGE